MEPEAKRTRTAPVQFADQVAIVTGGADGLGKAIVAMLTENGASVAIFDIAEQRMLEYARILQSQGHRVGTFKVDVSQEESVRRGFAAFHKEFDRLDVMVNCAGIVGPNGVKTTEVSVEDFDRVFAGELTHARSIIWLDAPLILTYRRLLRILNNGNGNLPSSLYNHGTCIS